MATKISNVLYIKVGNVTVTKLENQKRQELISGIKKYPVSKAYLVIPEKLDKVLYLGTL